jgi:hypothetical protein
LSRLEHSKLVLGPFESLTNSLPDPLVVEPEAMGVVVNAVVVTDATKHHPSLERETFSFPPLLWTIALTKEPGV